MKLSTYSSEELLSMQGMAARSASGFLIFFSPGAAEEPARQVISCTGH